MKCVVPLAGPDLIHPVSGFRPLFPIGGRPLLSVALDGRPWRGELEASDYVFVVRAVPGIEALLEFLSTTWQGSQTLVLSDLTEGAMISAMAGVALCVGDEPVIVDLADILFDGPLSPKALFADGAGCVVPCFTSSDDCYSYLRSEGGRVVEAAEKRVISDAASAGVYMFRDRQVFLRAAAHSLDHRDSLAYRGVLFVCPMVNGVLDQGLEVVAPAVNDVVPVGKLFH